MGSPASAKKIPSTNDGLKAKPKPPNPRSKSPSKLKPFSRSKLTAKTKASKLSATKKSSEHSSSPIESITCAQKSVRNHKPASSTRNFQCGSTNFPVLIVDNGGWTVKYGLVQSSEETANVGTTDDLLGNFDNETNVDERVKAPELKRERKDVEENSDVLCSIMFNATARPAHQLTLLKGDEITACMKNLGQLTWISPIERGMICDAVTQLRVWERMLEVVGVVPFGNIRRTANLGGTGKKMKVTSASAPTAGRWGKQGSLMTEANGTRPYPHNRNDDCNSTRQNSILSSANCTFLLLEPPFVPSTISERVDRTLFRELGMGRVARVLGSCMAAVSYLSMGVNLASGQAGKSFDCSAPLSEKGTSERAGCSIAGKERDKNRSENICRLPSSTNWINDGTKCCCVVDSGFSFTHVVPTYQGSAIVKAIRRLEIGGKLMTNLLKEMVTYRQWNMMNEYHIVNEAKERLCFVSNQFDKEMKEARCTRKGLRWFDREFVLPDFVHTLEGSVRLPGLTQDQKKSQIVPHLRSASEQQGRRRRKRKELDNEFDQSLIEEGDEDGKGRLYMRKSKTEETESSKAFKHATPLKNESITVSNKKYIAGEGTAAIDSSDHDSDDENKQERLRRLQRMRDQERKQMEILSLERQALAMSVERFAVPEVLFRPSDLGLDHGGIAEAIVGSINACDPKMRAAMYHNVLLVGGNANIPHLQERLESELRQIAPSSYPIRVFLPDDPVTFSWEGAKQFSNQRNFRQRFCIDRLDWEAMKKAGRNQKDIWGDRVYQHTQG